MLSSVDCFLLICADVATGGWVRDGFEWSHQLVVVPVDPRQGEPLPLVVLLGMGYGWSHLVVMVPGPHKLEREVAAVASPLVLGSDLGASSAAQMYGGLIRFVGAHSPLLVHHLDAPPSCQPSNVVACAVAVTDPSRRTTEGTV